MTKEMLINTVEGQECRIAILDNGRLEELYVERASSVSRVGNIYKGRVTNVESAIQAAFVDFGSAKNGFLHVSDIHPQYFPKGGHSAEPVGRKRAHRDRPPIQDCLKRGQEVVVQMTKEGIGTKGPTLTTYLSIPGRLLVMMPGMSRLGVSRKIEDEETREKLRQVFSGVNLPPDMGFIVRTAGQDRPKRDIQRDLNYLTRLWKTVSQRIRTAKPPAEIYKESDLVARTIRDVYNSDIQRIVCDTEAAAARVRDFLVVVVPRGRLPIEVYTGKEGLFHDAGLEREIERINSRRVELPSGGSIVIDQTEALVAIDVNSGRFRNNTDSESTALKINLEAAPEIARQLRLRDLGGVIIIDFIDMYQESKCRAVEKALRDAMKPDRAKAKTLRMSSFGIVEMTRQRVRPSLKDSLHRNCHYCNGHGVVKSEESLALEVIRDLKRAAGNEDVARIEVAVNPQVAHHLSNTHRKELFMLESDTGKSMFIRADGALAGNEVHISACNVRGSEVAWQAQPGPAPGIPRQLSTVPLKQLPAGRPKAPEAAKAETPPATVKAPDAKAPDAKAPDANAPQTDQPRPRRRTHRGGRKHARAKAARRAAGDSAAPQPAG